MRVEVSNSPPWSGPIGPRVVTVGLLALILLAGGAVPLAGENQAVLLALLAAPLLPAVLFVLTRSLPAAAFLLVLVQPLEGYELQTPVGTLSPGIVILGGTILVYHRPLGTVLERVGPMLWLVPAYMVSHVLHLGTLSGGEVAREMVKYAGFGAMWIAGLLIGATGLTRRVAVAAALALSGMLLLAMAASSGLVPLPTRSSPPRTIFGITSPFTRNFGTDLPFDATALLVPLCVPLIVLIALHHQRAIMRLGAALTVAWLLFGFAFVFQARGMVVQTVLAGMLAFAFTGGRLARLALIGGIVAGLRWIGLASLGEVDPISTQLRADGQRIALDVLFTEARWLPFGIPNTEVQERLVDTSYWGATLATTLGTQFQPIHNFILHELVTGGIVIGGLLVALLAVTAWQAVALMRRDRTDLASTALALGFALLVFELMIDPISSNALGMWLLIGMIGGRAAMRTSGQSTPAGGNS